jgi:MOB kinase activator 1
MEASAHHPPAPGAAPAGPPDRRVVTRSSDLPTGSLNLLVNAAVLKASVRQPPGIIGNHWLATHTVDFFQLTTVLYGALSSACTAETCACMNCGSTFEYLWRDPGQRPARLPAPAYVQRLSQWIDEQLNDETRFPSSSEYPADFLMHVKNIFRRLFRVFAHMYLSHYSDAVHLGVHVALNTAFIHFMEFAAHFDLVSVVELKPARELLETVCPDIAEERFRNGANATEA